MKHLPYTSYMPSASIQDESAFLPEKGCIRLVRRVLPESDEEKVTVSVERLARQLLDDMGNWSTREAEFVDEQIYFYLDEDTFNMPDEDIVEYLEKQ